MPRTREKRTEADADREIRAKADRHIFRNSTYESKWIQLKKASLSGLTFSDFPWPIKGTISSIADIKPPLVEAFLRDMKRKDLRQQLMLWHPDKFAKVKACFDASDHEKIQGGVHKVSQILIANMRGAQML
jgi:hypothetical protein